MFKVKLPAGAAAAVASTIASSTAGAAEPGAAAAASAKAIGKAKVKRGTRTKTLALIEKHRKIVEEAKRQKAELRAIAEQEANEQQQQQQLQQQKTPSQRKPAAPPVAPQRDPFTALVDHFLSSTQPYADLDETIQDGSAPARESPSPAQAPAVVTFRSFAASLVCPKKFYLYQNRSDLIPKASLGDMMHFDDSVGFNELARRWDRLQFGSRAVLVKESDFAQAVQHTENLITAYFQGPYRSLGEQAPSLTIHRPAFAVPFGAARGEAKTAGAAAMELRARPAVVRYRPKENQWVFLESQAVIDPVSTPSRISNSVQRFHFTALCFRLWLTQPHLPIEVRKKFLQVDLDGITKENLRGHALESSARPAAPIDLKRSGLLHIRQFFPGPATLLDCDPPRLVRFIQRASLEELMSEDAKYYGKEGRRRQYGAGAASRAGGGGAQYFSHHGLSGGGAGGAFDLRNFSAAVSSDPVLAGYAAEMELAALDVLGNGTAHSRTRSQRQKDEAQVRLFEVQQHLMEELLRQHTLPLVERQRQQQQHKSSGPAAVDPLTSFSSLMGDEGFVRGAGRAGDAATAAEEAGGKRKKGVKAAGRKVKAAAAAAGARGKHSGAGSEDGDAADEADAGVAGVDGEVSGAPCYGKFIGAHCLRGGESCPFFTEGMCLPRKVENAITARDNHLFTLPSTSLTRKAAWWAQGKRTIGDVLTAYENGETGLRLTSPQVRYANALRHGQVALNPREIDDFFARIQYPLFVIDFEAVQFALPPFDKELAYQSIPFQFSLDVFQNDVLTEEPTHYNYLHFGKGCSPNADPRPACIAELVRIVRLEREKKRRSMEASGELRRIELERAVADAEAADAEVASGQRKRRRTAPKPVKITRANPLEQPLKPYDGCFIAHFASFEKACLEKLGQLEEQYKDEIKSFWFLDTLDLIKKGCVHPNAHGSNSLKKVLPALCPDFQYGVFGSETVLPSSAAAAGGNGGSDAAGAGGAAEGQDEQKGENAMGVYRLWYHTEGGGTVQDLERARVGLGSGGGGPGMAATAVSAPDWSESVRTTMTKEARESMWHTLRIQLLEYCSLDTKALYEIMREIYKEREAAKGVALPDKSGWVFIDPVPREVDL